MQSLTPRQDRGDPWEDRGCCWVSCVCCREGVSSQQPSLRGSVFKQESEITCLWYPNIVAREEHLVSRPGTTYSEHCSLCFPRPLCPQASPGCAVQRLLLREQSSPPCPPAPYIPACHPLPAYTSLSFPLIFINMS